MYAPPQHPDDIVRLMTNLEQFINRPELADWDALVRMALIHHQFVRDLEVKENFYLNTALFRLLQERPE